LRSSERAEERAFKEEALRKDEVEHSKMLPDENTPPPKKRTPVKSTPKKRTPVETPDEKPQVNTYFRSDIYPETFVS
jgi:hypothetical protein